MKQDSWPHLPVVLTSKELANILCQSEPTIRRWRRLGKIPARKIGKQYLFDRDQIERLVKEGEL